MRFKPSLNNSRSTRPNLVNENNSVKLKANRINNLNAHNASAKVVFLHEALEGHKDNKLKFTDLLPEKIHCDKVEDAFVLVINDKQLLTHELKNINLNYHNGTRAKSIFKLVLSDKTINEYNSLMYEVDINNHKFALNQRETFRAFMLYAINGSELTKNDNSNILIMFLLDPHHLVFPVDDKAKNLNKNQVMNKTYDRYKDDSETFIQIFKDKFHKDDFIEIS